MSPCGVIGYVEGVIGGLEIGVLLMFPWVVRTRRRLNATETRSNATEEIRDKWERRKGQGE